MFNIYYFLLELLGSFKKLLFINQYSSEGNLRLFASGGILGGREKVKLGFNLELHGWLVSEGGKILIGSHTKIHHGTVISSMEEILIGNNCDIGADCYIQDHNSMSINYLNRRELKDDIEHSSIRIGDDVWIGRRATILKGVTIGNRSIVGTQSVVTHSVPDDTIVAGNPAVIVKKIN